MVRRFYELGLMGGLLCIVHSNPMDMPSRELNEDRDSGIARSGNVININISNIRAWLFFIVYLFCHCISFWLDY